MSCTVYLAFGGITHAVVFMINLAANLSAPNTAAKTSRPLVPNGSRRMYRICHIQAAAHNIPDDNHKHITRA